MNGHQQLISDEEKAQRAKVVQASNFSVDLEGFVASPALEALFKRYIAGEIDIDGVIDATCARIKDQA